MQYALILGFMVSSAVMTYLYSALMKDSLTYLYIYIYTHTQTYMNKHIINNK